MTQPIEDYNNQSQTSSTTIAAALFGFSGLVIGVGGYLAVMLSSKGGGWWTPTYITILLICGAISIVLGILTINRAGRLLKGKIALRILGVLATAVGVVIVSFVGSLLALMLLLSSSS